MHKNLNVYIAGPLFNPGERAHNLKIKCLLEPYFNIYLPQIDGALLPDLLSSGSSRSEARRRIFDTDIAAVRNSDVLLIILNGSSVDEGAAFELGVAWALGKQCFGYKDDFRKPFVDGENPMISEGLLKIFYDFPDLLMWAQSLSSNKKC